MKAPVIFELSSGAGACFSAFTNDIRTCGYKLLKLLNVTNTDMSCSSTRKNENREPKANGITINVKIMPLLIKGINFNQTAMNKIAEGRNIKPSEMLNGSRISG